VLWPSLLRKRIDSKLEYLLVAFVVCALANVALDEVCGYLVPLDIAGTVPPDPRNAFLRALITAGAQLPATLALGYIIAGGRDSR
jgi:hypothetical protein